MTLESAIKWLFVDALLRYGEATFDDVRMRVRLPSNFQKKRLGSIPVQMHKDGLIVQDAAVASKLKSRKGGLSHLWKPANTLALKRIHAEYTEADLGLYLALDPQLGLFNLSDEDKADVDAGGLDYQTLPLGENGVISRHVKRNNTYRMECPQE